MWNGTDLFKGVWEDGRRERVTTRQQMAFDTHSKSKKQRQEEDQEKLRMETGEGQKQKVENSPALCVVLVQFCFFFHPRFDSILCLSNI